MVYILPICLLQYLLPCRDQDENYSQSSAAVQRSSVPQSASDLCWPPFSQLLTAGHALRRGFAAAAAAAISHPESRHSQNNLPKGNSCAQKHQTKP